MTGHGGSRAAEYLKEHLFESLMKHQVFIVNTKLAISELTNLFSSLFIAPYTPVHLDTIESAIFILHLASSLVGTM